LIMNKFEKVHNEVHSSDCHNNKFPLVFYNINKKNYDKTNHECEIIHIPLSIDYNINYMSLGSCMFNYGKIFPFREANEHDFISMALDQKGISEIYKFQSIPIWKGENYVYEIITKNGTWYWCKKTLISKIKNLWIGDDLDKKEVYFNTFGYYIANENLNYLMRQNFVSHRANVYQVTTSDINKMISKLKNKTNGINK
jgi:hypothetical protein